MGSGLGPETSAEEASGASTQAARTTRSRSASGTDGTGEAAVEAKLDQILESQQQILKRLDEIMEELRIVKIRATMR